MSMVEEEIALAQQEIAKAKEALATAVRERRAATVDGHVIGTLDAAVSAAKAALNDAEVNLRRIYERKDDGE